MKRKDRKPYQCWKCQEEFTNYSTFKRHIRNGCKHTIAENVKSNLEQRLLFMLEDDKK